MISEATFRDIQSKTVDFVSNIANKVWENKLLILPAAILGYGLFKMKFPSKSNNTKSRTVTEVTEEDSKSETMNYTMPDMSERSYRRSRIYVPNICLYPKLSNERRPKEGGFFEDISTNYQSDKESSRSKVSFMDRKKHNYYLEVSSSDSESVSVKNEKRKKKKSAPRNSVTNNPDDLFFNIYEQFN